MKTADLKNIDFKALAESFKNLDPKDVGSWPILPRASVLVALFALILVAGWWFVWKGQFEELEADRQQELRLKDEWKAKKAQAVNLDLFQAQKAEIDRVFGALLKQLPSKTDIQDLLVEVNQSGLGRGLQFELFRPGAEANKEFIAEVPITVRLTGTYHDLGAFASDIGRLSRIVMLNNVSLTPSPVSGTLVMDAVTLTYRALDADELNKQKLAAKGAKR